MSKSITAQANIVMPAMKMEGHGRVVSNFALQHFKSAVLFREKTIRIETQNIDKGFGSFFEEIRTYASSCIMTAAASLEALINEMFIAHNGKLRNQFKDFEEEFWGKKGLERKNTLKKYQTALKMLNKTQFDENSKLFKDAFYLLELRNSFVHYKPLWDDEKKRNVELREVLVNCYEVSPFGDEGADFVTFKSMSSGCVNWTIITVVAFLREFEQRAQLDPKKMQQFWDIST